MKGVDISNQLIFYYELNFRTVRWWKRIFNEHIDVVHYVYLKNLGI